MNNKNNILLNGLFNLKLQTTTKNVLKYSAKQNSKIASLEKRQKQKISLYLTHFKIRKINILNVLETKVLNIHVIHQAQKPKKEFLNFIKQYK